MTDNSICRIDWNSAIEYYKDGKQHIPEIDFEAGGFCDTEEEIEIQATFLFNEALNKPYEDPTIFSPKPRQSIEGFIYDGVRIKRTSETEHEFDKIERGYRTYQPGRLLEIWRYSIRESWRGIKSYVEIDDVITVTKM